jgi:hypothetical protein
LAKPSSGQSPVWLQNKIKKKKDQKKEGKKTFMNLMAKVK